MKKAASLSSFTAVVSHIPVYLEAGPRAPLPSSPSIPFPHNVVLRRSRRAVAAAQEEPPALIPARCLEECCSGRC
jgi:hypothetical protein